MTKSYPGITDRDAAHLGYLRRRVISQLNIVRQPIDAHDENLEIPLHLVCGLRRTELRARLDTYKAFKRAVGVRAWPLRS